MNRQVENPGTDEFDLTAKTQCAPGNWGKNLLPQMQTDGHRSFNVNQALGSESYLCPSVFICGNNSSGSAISSAAGGENLRPDFLPQRPRRAQRRSNEKNGNNGCAIEFWRSWRFGGSHSRAFTFIEVLFAVIIVGIGFIMVAALFPVAIQQQQANVAEAAAVSVGRDALRAIQSAVGNSLPPPASGQSYVSCLPPTFAYFAAAAPPYASITSPGVLPSGIINTKPSGIMPLPDTLVTGTVAAGTLTIGASGQTYAVSGAFLPNPITTSATVPLVDCANPAVLQATGNRVSSSDRRFAWLGFYRRDVVAVTTNGTTNYVPAPYAQVWIVVAQATGEGQPIFSSPPGTKLPNFLYTALAYSAAGSKIQFSTYSDDMTKYDGQGPVADNAFALTLWSADANLIGQAFRLGTNLTADPTNGFLWNLAPGADINPNDSYFQGTPPSVAGNLMFVLGSPLIGGAYIGRAQDVAVVTGFVRVGN